MRTGTLTGLRVLLALALISVPATAIAHAVMLTPTPRDVGAVGDDARKSGPCGSIPRGANQCTLYEAGATIAVKWEETVPHAGCFQIALSEANDQNFTVLKQIQDPVGSPLAVYPDTVTLPPGVTCKDCTLVLRHLMIEKPCTTAPFQNDLDAATYYSCADIRVGDFPSAAPCVAPGPPLGSDGGPRTEPTDGGGKLVDAGGGPGPEATAARGSASSDGGGCSIALGATSGVSFAVTAALMALALVRRRRRRA